MTHAPVGDFGPDMNHALNRIGNGAREMALTPEQVIARFHAGHFCDLHLNGPTPSPVDFDALVALIREWIKRDRLTLSRAHQVLNCGLIAASTLASAQPQTRL